MAGLKADAMSGFSRDQMTAIPTAVAGFKSDQVAALDPTAMAGFRQTR